jgi:DNA-binding MarR family transcriptional regulator
MKEIEKPLEDVYFFWLDRAAKAYKNYAHQIFKSINVDLTDDQWMALKRIDEQDEINQKELSKEIYKDPASITRILDNLVKKDLIVRNMGNDRRTFNLSVTQQGKAIIEKVLPEAAKARAKGLEGISKSESAALISLLKRIQENFI